MPPAIKGLTSLIGYYLSSEFGKEGRRCTPNRVHAVLKLNGPHAVGLPPTDKPSRPGEGTKHLTASLASLASHELAARRCSAVKEGLSVRCRAMVECGWVWGEMGREPLRVLDAMSFDDGAGELPIFV